jgi:outer membrane protein, heavy metal efflux system
LNPVRSEQQFRARSLDGPLNRNTLTKYALEFSPDLAVARARVAVAEAALQTARQRINPSLSAEGGYNPTPESASTYSFSPAFTIETAGKRGYRILEASKLAEAARIAVYEEEWRVRSRLNQSLVNYWAAQRKKTLLQSERTLRDEIVSIYEKRVTLGEASNPEWNAARAGQASTNLSLRAAENEIGHALAALADATGLPASALDAKSIDTTDLESATLSETPPLLSIQKAGLLHRADIRRSLVEYEAADARLRLALANQYPNIILSPAYTFQEGFPAYTLSAAIESLPVFHRNQGPIAEQEALRKQLEAQFTALEAKVVGDTELALRQYSSAVREWREAGDKVTSLQQQREDAVTAAFKAGDKDRLDLTQARLETLAARRAQTEALIRAQTALLSLEDAVQSEVPSNRPETTN